MVAQVRCGGNKRTLRPQLSGNTILDPVPHLLPAKQQIGCGARDHRKKYKGTLFRGCCEDREDEPGRD
eukprot:429432-Rhodomonas_salina.4